ncbi:MAG: molybdenum cofactor biosynthesis protein MoaE [Chloroflexi bacterium]|nr:molybdenum cofactor biosynthesis protein MoaE [Chloroflexota bacterium]
MILLTREPLNPKTITRSVEDQGNGAVVTFLGVTRNQTDGRGVLYLEYEAYPSMAEKMLARIALEVEAQWGIRRCSIAHRFGRLEIGEVSLVVAIGSPHRAQAFTACAYVVDRIKEHVPIWKKEFFVDGEVWVGMEGRHATPSTR